VRDCERARAGDRATKNERIRRIPSPF
jgi:hypothetical protein